VARARGLQRGHNGARARGRVGRGYAATVGPRPGAASSVATAGRGAWPAAGQAR
jgi:hypothetical protein